MRKTALVVMTVALALAATSAAGSAGTTSPSARRAVETTQIKPASLDRGPDGTVPHVVGSDLVVGPSRFSFGTKQLLFLGTSGTDYLVGTWVEGRPKSQRVVRVTPSDQRTTVLSGPEPSALSLSSDGERIIGPRFLIKSEKTRVVVWDSHDGSQVATRDFRGYLDPLDAAGDDIVLAGSTPTRTFSWAVTPDTTTPISDRHGYEADLATDRLAVLTGDPYARGCSVVSTLSDPATRLWRSCKQAVAEFSPNGDRVVTVFLQSDGLGPGEVELREVDGTLLARYSAYYFGELLWEDDDTLLMRVHSKRRQAWVRCRLADCERASALSAS